MLMLILYIEIIAFPSQNQHETLVNNPPTTISCRQPCEDRWTYAARRITLAWSSDFGRTFARRMSKSALKRSVLDHALDVLELRFLNLILANSNGKSCNY